MSGAGVFWHPLRSAAEARDGKEVRLCGLVVQVQLAGDRLSRRGFSGLRLNVPKRLKTPGPKPSAVQDQPDFSTLRDLGMTRAQGDRVGVLS